MKILWHSNSAFSASGYGNQTFLFSELLKKAGHEVIVSSFYGLRDAVLPINGIPHIPGGFDSYGNDILPMNYAYYKPDVTLSLIDIWVLKPETLDKVPLAAWTPVDHNPIPPAVVNASKRARWPIAMSRFGEAEMRRAGLSPMYVPHGIDTSIFTPKDRSKAREMWGIPAGQFFAVMVAANKGLPSRKSLDSTLKAWAKFVQKHPDALLYMHTEPTGAFAGLDLPQMVRFYGLTDDQVRFPDQYRLLRGDYGWMALADLYNAADVLLAPSMGEGFGIPVVEAQASGCPVVVTDFTAQSELCFGGYKITVDPFDDLVWTLQSSEQAFIRPSKILAGIEWAFEHRGDEKLRQQAREGAMEYDGQRVLTQYMLPALERAARELRDERTGRTARTAQRLALREKANSPSILLPGGVARVESVKALETSAQSMATSLRNGGIV